MDQFQAELAETIRAAKMGDVRQPGQDPFSMDTGMNNQGMDQPNGENAKLPPGLENFTHE
jgi:hypothetical protein